MKKLFLVLILLISLTVPVFSEEPQDLEGAVLALETTSEEQENKIELTIRKTTYELEVYDQTMILLETSGEGQLEFESLDPSIVSVDATGYMRAISSGSTDIIIRFVPSQGESLSETISVQVLRDDGAILLKETEFYLIRDLYFDVAYSLEGSIEEGELIWESSKPSVASVENGRVTGKSIGSTTIRVSSKEVSASMNVYVTAPLQALAYNPEKLDMILGEETELPPLVYAPYDTTTSKEASVKIVDPTILELSNNKITALKVGQTKVIAEINGVFGELVVNVRPEKNKKGANIITLKTESQDQNQISFKAPDLALYEKELYSINLPLTETLEFLDTRDEGDIFIILDDSLYSNDMKKIDELVLAQEIMEKLEGKLIRIHLLNQNNQPKVIYEFKHGAESVLDLKFTVKELKESDSLYSLVNTKVYHASFASKEGFPPLTSVKIPAQATDAHYKQLHFIYQVKNNALSENNQEVSIDSQDYLNIELEGSSYLITLSKVSTVDDSKVIVTLSIVLFLSLLSGLLFYYYKAHYINKKV